MAKYHRFAALFGFLAALSLLGAACQPQQVEVEVTRPVEVVVTQPVEVVVTSVVEVTAAPTAVPSGPSVLRVGGTLDGTRYDPNVPTDVTVGVGANVFDTLTNMDENMQLQPGLATAWEYDQAEGAWTFTLRDDVFFHDGEKLTAQHIADYFNYFAQDSYMAGLLQIEPGATSAVDDTTLKIVTNNVQLPLSAVHPTTGIRKGDPFAGEHIGTGPFIFVEWVQNDHITVRKNPNYWGEPAGVDEMIIYYMPDPITRMLALQAGDVDVILEPPREALAALEGRAGIQLFSTVPASHQQLDLVVTGEAPYDLLQDPLVREAVGYAINRQELIEVGWGGFAVESQTLVAQTLLGEYAGNVQGYTYDPDRAAELLAEAGWADADGDGVLDKDGRRLALRMVNGWPSAAENGSVPELLLAQLAAVGIELEVVPVPDFPTLAGYLTPKEADIFLEIWTNTSPTPCLMPRFGFYGGAEPNLWQAAMSPAFIGYEEVNEELDSCSAATNADDAARWAAEALHTVFDEARTSIGLVGLYQTYAASDRVVEFAPHPIQGFVRWEATRLGN